MLRVGFIGAGRIADLHYMGYRDNPNARLYAVCDTDQSLLNRRASEWAVENVYQDYRKLLDDPNIDIVEIITPHHLHAEMSIAALEAGKHVSVQKPMAMSLSEADSMIVAADRSSKAFRVIENYRFYPPYNKIKELMVSGDIGDPMTIRIKSTTGNVGYGWDISNVSQEWRSDVSNSGEGSVLFDHGQHIWSLSMYLLGEVERVFSFIGSTQAIGHHEVGTGALLDTPAVISWKYIGSDTYGSCEFVHSHDLMVKSDFYPLNVLLEVTGSKGVAWVNRGPSGQLFERAPVELYRDGELTSYTELESDYPSSFKRGVKDFVDAIVEGRSSDLTGVEAREVLRFSLAVLLSGREHREVCLGEIVS